MEVTQMIEVLDPAGLLGSPARRLISLWGVTKRNLWLQSDVVSACRSALLFLKINACHPFCA